jgi:hypothetical protein
MLNFIDFYNSRKNIIPLDEFAHDAVEQMGKKVYEVPKIPLFSDNDDIYFLTHFPPQFRAQAKFQLLNDYLFDCIHAKQANKPMPSTHTFAFKIGRKNKEDKFVYFKNIPVKGIFSGHDLENPMGLYEKLNRTNDVETIRRMHQHDKAVNDPKWLLSDEAKKMHREMSAKEREKAGEKGPAGEYGFPFDNPKIDDDGRRSTEGFLAPTEQTHKDSLTKHMLGVKYGLLSSPDTNVHGEGENVKSVDPEARLVSFKKENEDEGEDAGEGKKKTKKERGGWKDAFTRIEMQDDPETRGKYYAYSYNGLLKDYQYLIDQGFATVTPDGIEFHEKRDKNNQPVLRDGKTIPFKGPKFIDKSGKVTWGAVDNEGKPVEFKNYMPVLFPGKMFMNDDLHHYTELRHAYKQMSNMSIDALITLYREYNKDKEGFNKKYNELNASFKQMNQATTPDAKARVKFDEEDKKELNKLKIPVFTYNKLKDLLESQKLDINSMLLPNISSDQKGVLINSINKVIETLPKDLQDFAHNMPKLDAHRWLVSHYSSNPYVKLKSIGKNASGAGTLNPNNNSSGVTTEGSYDTQKWWRHQPEVSKQVVKSVGLKIASMERNAPGSAKVAALRVLRDEVVDCGEHEILSKAGKVGLTAIANAEDQNQEVPPKLWKNAFTQINREISSLVSRLWQKNIAGTGTRRKFNQVTDNQTKDGVSALELSVSTQNKIHELSKRLGSSGSSEWAGGLLKSARSLEGIRSLSRAETELQMSGMSSSDDSELDTLRHKLMDAAVVYQIVLQLYQAENPNASKEEAEKAAEINMRNILSNSETGKEEMPQNVAASATPTLANKMIPGEEYVHRLISLLQGKSPSQFMMDIGDPKNLASANSRQKEYKSTLDQLLLSPDIDQEQKQIIKDKYASIGMPEPEALYTAPAANPVNQPVVKRGLGSFIKKPPQNPPQV